MSTALMRSFENRSDCTVMDEPLYSHYLSVTGLDHPGRDEIIAAQPADEAGAVAACVAPPARTFGYQKHMTHHLLPQTDTAWISSLTNVLLTRHPARVLASYARVRDTPTLEDIGVPQQLRLRDELAAAGADVAIIDADDFLLDPEPYLRFFCELMEVAFEPAMLEWPAGTRSSDGVWARYWYSAVEASTGFGPAPSAPPPERDELSAGLRPILDLALPIYSELHEGRTVL